MTAQVTEVLIHEGNKLSMCACPLGGYLYSSPKKWNFAGYSSACWRGYVGTWEIVGDRLYLKALDGLLRNGDDEEEAHLETLFPGFPDGVFAHWYSGTIRCPQGKMLNYVHGGFASTYERDLFLEFKSGVLVGQKVVVNGEGAEGAPEGYGVAGFTVFPRKGARDE